MEEKKDEKKNEKIPFHKKILMKLEKFFAITDFAKTYTIILITLMYGLGIALVFISAELLNSWKVFSDTMYQYIVVISGFVGATGMLKKGMQIYGEIQNNKEKIKNFVDANSKKENDSEKTEEGQVNN